MGRQVVMLHGGQIHTSDLSGALSLITTQSVSLVSIYLIFIII